MATTIEILLSSRFDATGFDAAAAKASEITGKLKGEFLTGETLEAFGGDIFPTGQVANFATELQQTADLLRQNARAATELGDTKLADKLNKKASAAQNAANSFKRLGSMTKSEVIKTFTSAGQSIDEMRKSLTQAATQERKYAEAATLARKATKAEVHLQRAAAIDREVRALDNLQRGTKEVAQEQRKFAQFARDFEGVRNLEEFEERLKQVDARLKAAVNSASDFQQRIKFADQRQELKQLGTQVLGTQRHFELFGQELGILEQIFTSTFNQIGFAMFVTQNTFRSLINVAKTFFKVLDEGARAAENFRAIALATNEYADSVADLNNKLAVTSGYVLDQGTAAQATARFLNQMGSEYGFVVDRAIEAATAIAVLGGSQEEANEFFSQALEAVRELDGAYIEAGIAALDLRDAESAVQLETIRLGRELSQLEKQAIFMRVFKEQTEDLIAASEGMVPFGQNIAQVTEGAASGFEKAKIGFSFFVDTAIGGAQELSSRVIPLFDLYIITLDKMGGAGIIVANILRTIKLGFSAIVGIGDTVQQTILAIGETIIRIQYGIAGAIAGVVLSIRELGEAVESLKDAGQPLADIFDAAKSGDIKGVLAGFQELGPGIKDALADIDFEEAFQRGIDAGKAAGDEMVENLKSAIGIIEQTAESADIKIDFSGVLEELKLLTDGTLQFLDNLGKAWQDHNDALEKIESNFNEKLRDINADGQERWLEAQEDFNKRSEDMAEDHADKLVSIDDDLAFRERRAQEDANDRVEKEIRKNNKKKEDLEESHQKKIDDILRRFELSRLKALIDRDARALFEAERRRDEDLKKEQEASEKKKQDEKERHDQAMKDLDAQLNKTLGRLNEDAERRRQQERERFKKQQEDLAERLDDEQQTILDWMEEQRQDAEKAAENRRKDAWKAWNKRKKDMQDAFKEQNMLTNAAMLEQSVIILGIMDQTSEEFKTQLEETSGYYETFRDDIEEYSQDIADALTGLLDLDFSDYTTPGGFPGGPPPPPGGQPPPPGGGGGGDQVLGFTPSEGQLCNRLGNAVYRASNGSRWMCIGGHWTNVDGQTNSQTTGFGPQFQTTGGAQLPAVQSPTGAPIPVVIQAQGDQTLETIFNEMAYNAFIQVVEP